MTKAKKNVNEMALQLVKEELKRTKKRSLTKGQLKKLEIKLKQIGYLKGGRVERV